MQNNSNSQSYSQPKNLSFSLLFKAFNLLPEARHQKVVKKDALKFVLRKWNVSQEVEIPIISKRLALWLFLADWWWLLGILLVPIGIFAVNYISYAVKQGEAKPNCLLDKDCITLICFT
jgi:hypothetical protein